jgi:hypothetical protein
MTYNFRGEGNDGESCVQTENNFEDEEFYLLVYNVTKNKVAPVLN